MSDHMSQPRLWTGARDDDADVALLGSSEAIRQVAQFPKTIARVSAPALLRGEPGTGKTLAGQLLHRWSGRDPARFVDAPASLFADGLALDQLLGHVPGAFTGALAKAAGVFERAHRGTLFLDEIADATLLLQCALLPLTELRPFPRLGGRRALRFDVRLVAATNADLEERVRQGLFRGDLLSRFGFFVVRMLPLREHLVDLPEIAIRALARFIWRQGLPARQLAARDLAVMMKYHWPGDVRDVENAMAYYATVGTLPEQIRNGEAFDIQSAVRANGGNKSMTARKLGVARQTVYNRLKAAEHASGDE